MSAKECAAPAAIDWPESLTVNSYHNFGIRESGVGGSLTAIAWADDASIEAVEHGLYFASARFADTLFLSSKAVLRSSHTVC